MYTRKLGFTLIELLIVIGILAVLLAITIIAINPARQFAKANDTRVLSSMNTILNAVSQCMIANKGQFTPCGFQNPLIDTSGTVGSFAVNNTYLIGNFSGNGLAGTSGYLDLCTLVTQGYIAAMPTDPVYGWKAINYSGNPGAPFMGENGVCNGDFYYTAYSISVDSNARVKVNGVSKVDGSTLTVTR